MDSHEWSRQYPVWTITRLDLQHTLHFSHEQVASLTDQDMGRIAEMVREHFSSLEAPFTAALHNSVSEVLSEKGGGDETSDRGA